MFDTPKTVETLEYKLLSLKEAERIDALFELAECLVDSNSNQALELSQQARELALTLNDETRLTEAYLRIGRVELRQANYEQAEKTYQVSLDRSRLTGNEFGEAASLNGLGSIKFGQGQLLKALEYLLPALELSLKNGFLHEQLKCSRGLGNVYTRLGQYDLSLGYYLKALELCEISLKVERKPQILLEYTFLMVSMADQLLRLEKWNESIEYSERVLELNQSVGNNQVEIVTRENFAEAYLHLGQPAQALLVLEKALDISRQINERRLQIRLLNFLGLAETGLGNFESARNCFGEGLNLARQIDSPEEELLIQTSFAEHLLGCGETSQALDVLHQTLELSERLGLPVETCRSHELFVKANERQHHYQAALIHYKDYHLLKLQLHGENHFKSIRAIQVQHEVEKTRQIAELERLSKEELQRANQELAEANRRNQELLEQVQHQARHDPLTGLPNRILFEDRLQQTLAYATRYNLAFALLFLDLDGFKFVNDTFGHDAGDELLVQVANRFKNCLRASDCVARFGGDEFMVMVSNLCGPEDAAAVGGKLLNSLKTPFEILGHQVSISTSIGVSLYPRDGVDITTLQKHSDVAMYQVKFSGKQDICFYLPGMNQAEIVRTVIETTVS